MFFDSIHVFIVIVAVLNLMIIINIDVMHDGQCTEWIIVVYCAMMMAIVMVAFIVPLNCITYPLVDCHSNANFCRNGQLANGVNEMATDICDCIVAAVDCKTVENRAFWTSALSSVSPAAPPALVLAVAVSDDGFYHSMNKRDVCVHISRPPLLFT
uniref:Uncharacterized protein n=1 Tax=Glossina austeni TaxID=7395 RepID=A0A1A9VQQ6_GLOAU